MVMKILALSFRRRHRGRTIGRLPLPVAGILVASGLLAAACTEEVPTDFNADTRTGFMAACSRPLDDPRLISGICQCVFDETQVEITFDEFVAADQRLVADQEQPLSDELNEIIADCIVEEGDL